MRIFNADGTEAEMCGNGIRCLAKLLYFKEIVKKDEIRIETLSGIKKINFINEVNVVNKIEVNMGKAYFDYKKIPVYLPFGKNEMSDIEIKYDNKNYKFVPVSCGNPHVVCFVDDFEFNFEEIGEYVEKYKYFPKKTNVEFVKIESKNKIITRVWERGVGRTLACGTGAVASAAASMKKLYVENKLNVELEGGILDIELKNGEMHLIGNAEFVYEGKIKL